MFNRIEKLIQAECGEKSCLFSLNCLKFGADMKKYWVNKKGKNMGLLEKENILVDDERL